MIYNTPGKMSAKTMERKKKVLMTAFSKNKKLSEMFTYCCDFMGVE
jgi:hypothetical protein